MGTRQIDPGGPSRRTHFSVTADQTELASLAQKLETIAPPALEHIVASAGPYLRDEAAAGAPVRTGALSMSLVSEAIGLQARVYSPLDYALPQEFGVKRGGRGMRGRFFLRRAIQMLTESELPRLFQQTITELERAWAAR